MTTFTDRVSTIDIRMAVWDQSSQQYGPDFEKDFFDVGNLEIDEESGAYLVEYVFYLAEQAEDWKNGVGDYIDDFEGQPGHTPDDRLVEISDPR